MSRGFDGFEIDDFRGSDFGRDRELSRSPSSDWNKWSELHNIHREEERADRLNREGRDRSNRGRPPLAREKRVQTILSQRVRSQYADRDKTYSLRDSEIHTLSEVGKFRVVATGDLAKFAYNGDRSRAENDVETHARVKHARYVLYNSLMSPGRGNKRRSGSPAERKTDWFGIVVPLLISFALAVPIINNESPTVLIFAWLGVAVALAWSVVKLVERFSWALWKKSIPIAIATAIVLCASYWNIKERLRPSFVFVTPGPLFDGDTWDFIVNHRGSKTNYNVQILFVDDDRLEYLRRTTQSVTQQDVNSFQLLLPLSEVNPKGRGTIFARQFQWKPFSLANSHFTAEITWRDGAAHEEIRIARVQDKWKYAISLSDKESGKSLFYCKDDGFPSAESLPACFPRINYSD